MANKLLLVNPKKRRSTRKKRRVTAKRRKRNPIAARSTNPMRRRRRSVRRRNPTARGLMGIVQSSLLPAATAATGALALDIAWGFLPIPAQFKAGPLRHVVKGAGAIGMGMLAAMVVNRKTAEQFTTGALTVTMHGAMKEMAGRFMPQLALGAYINDDDGMGYVAPAVSVDDYDNDEMGYYTDGGMSAAGDYNDDMDVF